MIFICIFSILVFLYVILNFFFSAFISKKLHRNYHGKLFFKCIIQNSGLLFGSLFGLFLNFFLYKLGLSDSVLAIPGSVFVVGCLVMTFNVCRATKEFLENGMVSITYLQPVFQ